MAGIWNGITRDAIQYNPIQFCLPAKNTNGICGIFSEWIFRALHKEPYFLWSIFCSLSSLLQFILEEAGMLRRRLFCEQLNGNSNGNGHWTMASFFLLYSTLCKHFAINELSVHVLAPQGAVFAFSHHRSAGRQFLFKHGCPRCPRGISHTIHNTCHKSDPGSLT